MSKKSDRAALAYAISVLDEIADTLEDGGGIQGKKARSYMLGRPYYGAVKEASRDLLRIYDRKDGTT